MCKSIVDGGQRCASHTRQKFYALSPADGAAFDAAAAEYASTREGGERLQGEAVIAEQGRDYELAARLHSALQQGEAIRAANRDTAVAVDVEQQTREMGMRAERVAATALRPGMYVGRKTRITETLSRPSRTPDGVGSVLCAVRTRGSRSGSVMEFREDDMVTVWRRT